MKRVTKTWQRMLALFVAFALAFVMVPRIHTKAADAYDGEFEVFIGFGGDLEAENDWGYCFNSPGNEGNNADIQATTATAKVGDTVTVSLEFPTAVVNTWWMAPVVVAEGVSALDAEVSLKIDGKDVAIDASAGDAWWYEATGDYTDTQSIRLYGGFNEWAVQYIEEPANFTKVEYTITINSAEAAPPMLIATAGAYEGEFEVFVGFGGDKEAENDWGYCFNAPGDEGNNPDIVATTATAKVGDTVTVSLEFPTAVVNTWWMAPVVVAEGITELEAEVSLKIDDKDVEIDPSVGDAWWYEQTGLYSDKQAIRLFGGFNEWAAQYIEEPANFTKVEYTITVKSAAVGAPAAVGGAYEGEAQLFIGFGGDKDEENDWAFCFNSPDNEGNNPDIQAAVETIKVGETKTVSLEFPSAVANTWWMAPVLVAEGIAELDAEVSLKIDGKDVEIDPSAGDAWWYEQTGDYTDTQAIRLYGGFNEWGAQYIGEPANFTKVEYTVTLNAANVAGEEDGGEAEPVVTAEVDKDGEYNAYILIQTPKYSFRNAWYDPSYGLGYSDDTGLDYFNQITGWDEGNNAFQVPGEIQDTKICGNGTYTVSVSGLQFADDEFSSQDHFNLIAVDTDIPNTGDITISDMELSVNGMGVDINPVISPDAEEYLTMLIQNIWNEDVKEIGYTPLPVTDVKITFTVSGFNYDKAEEATEAATEAAANGETTEATVKEEKKGLSAGAIAGIAGGAVAVIGAGVGVGIGLKKKGGKKD